MGKTKKKFEKMDEKERQTAELAARMMSTAELAALLVRAKEADGERYCFILGSGASVESGIRAGNELEMAWMNCLMGKEADRDGTPKMILKEQEKRAKALYDKEMLKHPFAEIKKVWEEAVEDKKKTLPSEYYFDIYGLRFYTAPKNGYRYLEREMDGKEPSIGYYALALLLTENDKNNVVITTNFDSLTEDALFRYTPKKPLVVSHEALAGFIDANVRRPVIAKVHRGLLFDPFNSPETVGKLQDGWKDVLTTLFRIYTPIVVGYAGGDHSLMGFLKETELKGLYWCCREDIHELDERVKDLLIQKDGRLVKINGFDDLMVKLGMEMYPDKMNPTAVENLLEEQYRMRRDSYEEQYTALVEKNGETVQQLKQAEEQKFAQQEQEKKLTAKDYYWRAVRALADKRYEEAIIGFTSVIELQPDNMKAYGNRGNAYSALGKTDKAIADYDKVIELQPDDAKTYYNRGNAYNNNLKEYDKAIRNYDKALELDPNYAKAYNNRGNAYDSLGEYEKAIADFAKALELQPDYAKAYKNRGIVYRRRGAVGDAERAAADEKMYRKLTSKA